MAEKILNTRLQLKYDSYANWTSKNPILKSGEMAIATVASGTDNATNTGFTNLPNIVLKVGDGSSHYNDLKFVSALAADVHNWAKEASKPAYGYSEISGLEQFVRNTINSEVEDTDTQYTISAVSGSTYKFDLKSKGLGETAWTHVAYIDLTDVATRLTSLETLVGTKSVSSQIATAIDGLNATKVEAGTGEILSAVSESAGVVSVTKRSLVKADIPTIDQSQVSGLSGSLAAAANAGTNAAAQALSDAKEYTDDEIDAAVQALSYTDPNYAAGQFVTKVTESNGVIAVQRATIGISNVSGLQTKLNSIDSNINSKQNALTFTSAPNSTDNRVATEQFVLESVADLNGAMHFVGALSSVPTNNSQYAAGDVILVGYDEYVFDGTTWKALGNESIYQTKSAAQSEHAALQSSFNSSLSALDQSKQDALTFSGTPSSTNPVMTDSAVDGLIATAVAGLQKTDTAVSKQFVTAVSEANGVVSVTRAALKATDIPVIEQSQVNGLSTALTAASNAGTSAAATALANAKSYTDTEIDTAIQSLDYTDTAVSKYAVTAVSETDGIVKVTRAKLADVAWSGNVKDLEQTSGDVLVFNCGSASVNI